MPKDKINKFKSNIDAGKITRKIMSHLMFSAWKKFNDSKSNNKNVPILDLSKSKHNKLEINKSIQDIKSNQIDETTCYLTKIHL